MIETEEEYIERLAQEDTERRRIQKRSIERKNDAESYKGTWLLGSIKDLIEDG